MYETNFGQDLLLGVLALQNGFINADQLLTGFRIWSSDRSSSLLTILQRQDSISAEVGEILERLGQAHVEHSNDAKSLNEVTQLAESVKDQPDTIDENGLRSIIRSINSISHSFEAGETELELTRSLIGESSLGRFQILRPHAKGGLGEVFVARDQELGREVALKQIRQGYEKQPESRERFFREAEITGKLEHPGIVPVYGMGKDGDGKPYYAMRFIRGKTLSEAIADFHKADKNANRNKTERNKEFRRLLGWFVDVCQAMEYAHSRGVLHRDIKPSNIMLGKFGETLIVDWGLSRTKSEVAADPSLATEQPIAATLSDSSSNTIAGQAIGTPSYMSPEQASGRLELIDVTSDVYCLGSTLFALLTSKPPIEERDLAKGIRRILDGDIERPSELAPKTPKALEAICLKAMALEPNERYRSPKELANEIEAWLADEPVASFQEPWGARVRRWIRHHQTGVAVAAAGILILTAATTVATLLLQNKNSALSAAYRKTDLANQELKTANETIQKTIDDLQNANDKVLSEKKRADSVKEFLVDAFRQADPQNDGRKLTVFEVLKRSSAELGDSLEGDPLTKAELLSAIGKSYIGLGLYDEAIKVYEREKAIRLDLQGADDPATMVVEDSIGLAYWKIGDLKKPLEIHQENLERRQRVLGDEHEQTLTSENNLGLAYDAVGDYVKYHEILNRNFEKHKKVLGEQHEETLTAKNNYAIALNRIGKNQEALVLLQEVYESRKETQGELNPMTLLSLDNLGYQHYVIGEYDLAIELHEKALKERAEVLGEHHPDTLISETNLGNAYWPAPIFCTSGYESTGWLTST